MMKKIIFVLALTLVLSIAGFAQTQVYRSFDLPNTQATQYVYASSGAGDSLTQWVSLLNNDNQNVYQKYNLYPDSITVYCYNQDSVNAKIYFETQTFGETATRDSVGVVTATTANGYNSFTVASTKWKFRTLCNVSAIQSATGIGYGSGNKFRVRLILWYKLP